MKRIHYLKFYLSFLLLITMTFSLVACGGSPDSGDPAYEAQTITIEGLPEDANSDVTLNEITVAELRKLPQHELDASYKRTTGMTEEFKMSGPYLSEVIEFLGGDLNDYAGIGVLGTDGYYCLISKEVIHSTPDLMLAIVIDGKAKLDEDNAPARLAVQGQFGPYWVKRVEKIILYKEIPEKEITSVWIFNNLAEGIEPYAYEYYGSKDKAIDLEQIFSRLDYVDSKAFFTMKSSDGFKKNEVINMVKSRYYIKIEGQDAPTNVSPYIKLGMNVQNIAWISTNADAAVFPEQLLKYMDKVNFRGQEGITLAEVLYETEMKSVKTETFDLLSTSGDKITVPGEDMDQGILVYHDDGSTGVVWNPDTGYKDINNLLRIRIAKDGSDKGLSPTSNLKNEKEQTDNGNKSFADSPDKDTVLTILGDGLSENLYLSMEDLKRLKAGYLEQCYSSVNNYPTRKFSVAKGVSLSYLLNEAGIGKNVKSIMVEAADGYKASFTKDQLLGKQYRYPELLSGSAANAVQVNPLIAWAFAEGKDFAKAKEGELRLVIGQNGLNDVNTAGSVQMVSKITVSAKDPGNWPKPTASVSEGMITINHDSFDQVKLYYTLDGSVPTVNSQIYNPSTTYFQPDLIKPIPVKGSGTLNVKAVGYGKRDSEVLTYAY